MARVFPTLTSKQQQYLGELAAGNRQVKVLNSILMGWQDVEQAVDSATNSVGSAEEENKKFLQSIEGRIQKVSSSFQQLSQHTIDSDWIKGFVDLANVIVNATDKVGLLRVALFGLITFLTSKAGKEYALLPQVA